MPALDFVISKDVDNPAAGTPGEGLVAVFDRKTEYNIKGKTHGLASHALKHWIDFEVYENTVKGLLSKTVSIIKNSPEVYIMKVSNGKIVKSGDHARVVITYQIARNTLDMVQDKLRNAESLNDSEKKLLPIIKSFMQGYGSMITNVINTAIDVDSMKTSTLKHILTRGATINFLGGKPGKENKFYYDPKTRAFITADPKTKGRVITMFKADYPLRTILKNKNIIPKSNDMRTFIGEVAHLEHWEIKKLKEMILAEMPWKTYNKYGIGTIDFQIERMPIGTSQKKILTRAFHAGSGFYGYHPVQGWFHFSRNGLTKKNPKSERDVKLPNNWLTYARISKMEDIEMKKSDLRKIIREEITLLLEADIYKYLVTKDNIPKYRYEKKAVISYSQGTGIMGSGGRKEKYYTMDVYENGKWDRYGDVTRLDIERLKRREDLKEKLRLSELKMNDNVVVKVPFSRKDPVLKAFAGKKGQIIGKEKDGSITMWRVRFRQPVDIPEVGKVSDDLFASDYLKKIQQNEFLETIYPTKKAAMKHLRTTFTKDLQDRHVVIPATKNGKKVGWMLKLNTSNNKKY